MLAAIGGYPEPVQPAAIAELVARLRCVTWAHPYDEIWFIHLAIEDPVQGTAWVIDGRPSISATLGRPSTGTSLARLTR